MDNEISVLKDPIISWDISSLRTVRYEETKTTIFSSRNKKIQKIYTFPLENNQQLSFRVTNGFLSHRNILNSIWLKGHCIDSGDVFICIESSYIFQQTGCIVTPKIVEWGGDEIISLIELCQFSIQETSDLIKLRIDKLLFGDDIPKISTLNYISLDIANCSQLMLISENNVLNKIEDSIKNYCESYWQSYDLFGKKISLFFKFTIYPKKRFWTNHEINSLQLGDLVSLQNFKKNHTLNCLRGYIQTVSSFFPSHRYEVYLKMNEDDTRLEFGKDDIYEDEIENDSTLPPHEQIELEIFAGKTKILFNELCSIQEGSLIEIRDHSLPSVILSVMGTPILEGELVHFQEQLMVQITRKIT